MVQHKALKIVRGQLPPTRSYKHRSWWLVKNLPGDFFGRLGITAGKTTEEYLIDENESVADFSPGYREFFVVRQTGKFEDDRQGVYLVSVTSSNVFRCSCTGDATRGGPGACKHADTIRDLLDRGELPPRRTIYHRHESGATTAPANH